MTSIADYTGLAARIEAAMNCGAYNVYKPVSARTELAVIRHFVRANDERLKRLWAEEKRVRKLVEMLAWSPFNKHRVDQVKTYIDGIVGLRKLACEAEQRLGRMVIEIAPRVDAETTMAQRLEILNWNSADLGRLDKPDIGLVELIAVYCVEDSASHRKDEFRSRPLFNAINAEIMRVMFDTPEGREASRQVFDGMFSPGGIFHGLPTYYMQPDGTMKRKAPSLVLHDAAGSRVIERAPS
jgi:hypothetical protein